MSLTSRLTRPFESPAKTLISRTAVKQEKCIEHAHHSFDETPLRDLFSLNALLAAYVRDNDALAAWGLFRRMHRERSDLNSYTFTPVLGACSLLPDPERGRQIHALVIKTGSESETVTKTTLIDMYSKCGYLGDSVRVFEEMRLKDVVAWNTMLSSFLRHGFAKNALSVFESMRRDRVKLSEFTLCSILKACASLDALRQGKQVHALVIVTGRDLVVLGTTLIDFYSNCGFVREAMKVFCNINCRKDDVIYNSLVSGCVRNRKYKEAFSIMSKMKPNLIVVTSAIAACSENSDLWIGKQIHCVAIRLGFMFDTQLCNVLLDMYAKCGKILTASLLFDRIPQRNVVSWTSIIDAFGRHGRGIEAIELFKKMGEERSGVSPNQVTFLAVLSACSHSGLVEQGRECFVLMREKHGVEPGPEHYACFIDLLGRAGQIEEVWCLFHDMVKRDTKPTRVVWAAVLNACRVNLDVTRGEFAAKHLFELEPDEPGNYVMLSNFYAAVGRWDGVEDLRSTMKEKHLIKEAGSSWVTAECCHEAVKCIS